MTVSVSVSVTYIKTLIHTYLHISAQVNTTQLSQENLHKIGVALLMDY